MKAPGQPAKDHTALDKAAAIAHITTPPYINMCSSHQDIPYEACFLEKDNAASDNALRHLQRVCCT